jgi:hypothetical protein
MDNHTQELASQNRNIAVSLRRFAGLCAVAVAVAGCAASLGRDAKDVVAERAQLRWNELVKGEFAAAYKYASPASRAVITSDTYVSSLRRNFWTGAEVKSVECPTSDSCDVEVLVAYKHWGLAMETGLKEKWIRQGSDWWIVLPG